MVQPTDGDQPVQTDDDATVLVSQEDALPVIPGYQLTQHIGAGGMAHVWLAVDNNLKRQVALKTMSVELSGDEGFDQRFIEEAQIVAGFRHSNIVSVFARGKTDDQQYIAMEFISGGTLGDRLERGVIPKQEATEIAMAMADALAYSHKHSIIHRDFKPGNILFTDEGIPVLSDFGIAKSVERTDPDLTVPGLVIGSPKYMAPEQKLGMPLSAKVDVYALGLVFFEMLSGTVPPIDIASVRSSADAEALAKLLPSGCQDVAKVIADCLREDPTQRPAAADVAASLRMVLAPKAAMGLGAKVLGGVGILGLVAAVLFSVFGNPQYDLQFELQPASTNVYIDGQLLSGNSALVEPGVHQILAIGTDHYGEVLSVNADEDMVLTLELQPTVYPSFVQFETFNALFQDDTTLEDIDRVNMDYGPYQRLLELKRHQITGDTTQTAKIVSELNALAKVGDPAAQLMLFVANFDQVISGDRYSNLVQQASNSGYGLATFYQALHYRWSREQTNSFDITSLQVYRGLMALAQEQGLQFAADFVAQADAILQSS